MMKNKRGFIAIVMYFALLFMILIIGFIGSIVFSVIDFGFDEITPIMTELGVVGGANVSQAAQFTFGTLDKTVNAASWMIGFAYVLALIFSVVFAISYSFNPNPVYIGLYFMFVVLLIFGAIIMSNMYEDIYTGNDEIAERLQEQTLLSFMLLHSPIVLTLISVITGVYIFARREESAGSFGV